MIQNRNRGYDMLRLPGCLPGLKESDGSELIHRLLLNEIDYIIDVARDASEEEESFYDEFFPEYLRGTGIPEQKTRELVKIMISPKEYTPDLEIEYALNQMIQELKGSKEVPMETVRTFYSSRGCRVPEPDEFFEALWESIFWDMDYKLLDKGYTLAGLEGSLVDQICGITGGLSAFPEKDELSRCSQ